MLIFKKMILIHNMIYYFGIDNIICKTNGTEYENSSPYEDRIEIINKLFDDGNTICYNSDREQKTGESQTMLLYKQLKDWKCKYTSIKLDMLHYDYLIDNNTYTGNNFFETK
jgi:hypothetical protein